MKKVETGIEAIDKLTRGGFKRGKVTLLCGRPGMGKSTVATKLAISMAERGHEVDYFNLELSPVTTAAIRAAWDKSPMVNGKLNLITSNDFMDINDIVSDLFYRSYADVVIFDYVQLIGSRTEKKDGVLKTGHLRYICEEFFPDKAFIWCSMLPNTGDSWPHIDDADGIVGIDRDPYAALLLYRNSYYNSPKELAELSKNHPEIANWFRSEHDNDIRLVYYHKGLGRGVTDIPWNPHEYVYPYFKEIGEGEEYLKINGITEADI